MGLDQKKVCPEELKKEFDESQRMKKLLSERELEGWDVKF